MVRLDSVPVSLPNFHGLADSATILEVKEKWLSGIFGDIVSLGKVAEPRWNIEANNFYASGESTSYFGDGLYSNLTLEHRAEIAGLPIGISGDLILQNNRVNNRLSAISIEFDQEALLNKYREQIGKKAIKESFDGLLDEQQQSLKENFSIEASRQILLSEIYQFRKSLLQHFVDSLTTAMRTRGDSLTEILHGRGDSILLDSLKSLQKDIKQAEHQVDSLYNATLSKWNETQQTIQEWREEVMARQQLLEDNIEIGALHKYTDKQGVKSWLLNVSRFQLGSFRMRNSPFDVSSVPLHGLGMEIRRNGYYASISYGKEGRQQRKLPSYVQNLRLAGEGRTILQAKAGIGMPERSHLHLTFSSIQMKGTNGDSINLVFPKRNVLMSLDSRYLISDQFFIEMTGSVSSADFTGTSTSKELINSLYGNATQERNNMAGLFRVGWRDKEGHSEYSVGYQTVGGGFITLGNLFLIKNRNALRLEGKQRFMRNRGQLTASYLIGVTNYTAEITPGIQQNQFSGELSFRLNKHGSRAWVKYSPSYYLQNAPGSSSTVYQMNLAMIGSQWMFPRGEKGQWMTMLQLTNFADESKYGDTSVVTGLWYGMLTQTYSSDKYMVTALTNVGIDKEDLKSVRDVNVDISQTWMLKSIQFTQGIQVIKRFYGSGFLVGGSGGIHFNTKKQFRIGLNGTYYMGVSNSEKNQFYFNSSASWQF